MENELLENGQIYSIHSVLSSSFQDIIDQINRGVIIFSKGYLKTLGEMKSKGIIEVDLNKDGSSVVRFRMTANAEACCQVGNLKNYC